MADTRGLFIFIFHVGHAIPTIAFGTWKLGNGQGPIDQVDQALSVGFEHIGVYRSAFLLHCFVSRADSDYLPQFLYADTAQAYGNEEEAGKAFHESGLARSDVFITTKFSGRDGLDIETSIQNSLKNVRVYFVGTRYCSLLF